MIHTPAQLLEVVSRLGAESRAGLDTEADSLHAYPEKLCLIQLSFAEADVLIDPLAGLDMSPLLQELEPKILVLHGADYDLRMLHRAYDFVPKHVFDTMWAARLLGYREFGLRHLVHKHLGVTLEKGPQKMNWALRPLPQRMATYALNDTRYLRPLANILSEELRKCQRLVWHEEVCRRIVQECARRPVPDPDGAWRIKGSDRLEPLAMAVLKEIWQWREEEALAANKPPYFIFAHEKLVAVAAAAARGKPVQPLVPHTVPAKRAARLALAIERGLKTPVSGHPERRRRKPQHLTRQQQTHFDQLKRFRDSRAEELGLDPTILASKAELIELARNGSSQEHRLMRWQRDLLSDSGV